MQLKKNLCIVLKVFKFLFFLNSNFKLDEGIIEKICFCCFSWMLLGIKMKLTEMLVYLVNNIPNIFLVQFWSLETSSRIFYGFQKISIAWRQFIFSAWWLTILIVTVYAFKRTKIIIMIKFYYQKIITTSCWVIATGWKLKKGLELGPSLQNQTRKELEMFVVHYTNISPSFTELSKNTQKTINMERNFKEHGMIFFGGDSRKGKFTF